MCPALQTAPALTTVRLTFDVSVGNRRLAECKARLVDATGRIGHAEDVLRGKEHPMILAEKIIDLRKKNGWSQEQLADKLGVSRQSISKWESAQSTPDMKKIVALSELFGVSTDYLLKDGMDDAEGAAAGGDAPDRAMRDGASLTPVSMEEAGAFLAHNERNARRRCVRCIA